MITRISLDSLADLTALEVDTIIDVRSPSEFADDHVPRAINLPVLSDAERAEVGTIYKQESPFKARKIGAALIAKNTAHHLQQVMADKPHGWQPFIYCWRGGQRSGAMAIILSQIGWRVGVLEGGYKAYRHHVVDFCRNEALPHRLVLIDGNTGTGKTEILGLLAEKGHQVLDLEGLAAHRGSVFGAVSQEQPSQKAFEGAVAHAFASFTPDRPVYVEAESAKVGNLHIPASVWLAMQKAKRLQVSAPIEQRAQFLVRAYSDRVADRADFLSVVQNLKAIQGAERIAAWEALLAEDKLVELAEELIIHHYDPRYGKARERHEGPEVAHLTLSDLSRAGLRQSLPIVEAALAEL